MVHRLTMENISQSQTVNRGVVHRSVLKPTLMLIQLGCSFQGLPCLWWTENNIHLLSGDKRNSWFYGCDWYFLEIGLSSLRNAFDSNRAIFVLKRDVKLQLTFKNVHLFTWNSVKLANFHKLQGIQFDVWRFSDFTNTSLFRLLFE